MPTNLELYSELKTKFEKKQREADKAQGALDEAMRMLKEKFGVNSLNEAKALLDKLQTEEDEANKALDRALATLKQDYGHLFE